MILNNIDNLYVGSTNALKVYLGSLLIWSLSNDDYDVIPTDITSYTGSKSRVYVIDVDKWYMRTIGGNYKEYGIIASSKSADPYVGELAIDNYHEWEYTSNGWVDLGALTTHTEYEYVQGNGTSYIITDYVPQPNASVEIDCDGYVEACVFGSREVKNNAYYGYFGIEYVNTFLAFLYGSTDYGTRDIVIQSRGVVKIDNVGGYVGTTKLVNVSTSIPSDCKGHCGIFCCTETDNTTGVETVSKRGIYTKKIYDVKIYENGTLVRHYIPAIKNGAVGFYETENKVLWDSEVSTPFTVGGSSREVADTLIKAYAVIPTPYDVIPTDITSYTGSKSCVYVIDVAKWYLRTVGGNYKEYGVVASSKADPYIGELAIIDYHEWEYTATGWVDLGNNSSRLTSDYTELAYVGVRTVSSASPYITLNYYPKEATVIDAKFRPLGGKVVGTLYYAYPSTDTKLFNFIISNGATGQTTYWRFYPTNVKKAVSNIIHVNTDYVFKSASSGCWLNNTKIWSRTGTYPSQNTSQLRVLNSNDGTNFNLYYFNITENSTALYTLVPSLRNIDSKIGLYDTVNNTFYLSDNDSTNPLVAGDVLPYPKDYAVLPAPTN